MQRCFHLRYRLSGERLQKIEFVNLQITKKFGFLKEVAGEVFTDIYFENGRFDKMFNFTNLINMAILTNQKISRHLFCKSAAKRLL